MWLVLSAALACADATSAAALVEALEGAEAAYTELSDDVMFHLDRVGILLPCVTEPVAPTVAARVHRVQGLRLWASQRRLAVGALRAAREVDPAYTWPDTLLAPEHTARATYEGWSGRSATERAKAPRNGELHFDGVATRRRPSERPTLLQLDGQTLWLAPDEPLPSYEVRPPPVAPLAAVSGTLIAGAATSYGLAWSARGRATTLADAGDRAGAEAAVGQTNALTAVAAGTAVSGLVVGGLAAWLGWSR